MNPEQTGAAALANLQASYGAPSQAGFGSAVFYTRLQPTDDLATAALAQYRYFVGDLWERYGADAWLGPWREVYARPAGASHDITAELRGIDDREAALAVPLILDVDPVALAAVFDDPGTTELRVFTLGDGEAMSGLLISARRALPAAAIFLVFLMD